MSILAEEERVFIQYFPADKCWVTICSPNESDIGKEVELCSWQDSIVAVPVCTRTRSKPYIDSCECPKCRELYKDSL